MTKPQYHNIALNNAKVISSFSDSLSERNAEVEHLITENKELKEEIESLNEEIDNLNDYM